jgi:hypothetical protein
MHLRIVVPKVLIAPEPPSSANELAEPTLPSDYLNWLQGESADVDLLGLRLKEGRSLKLDTVYVPLSTQAREKPPKPSQLESSREDRDKPQLLLDLLDKKSLYISGDPGSGKSTFCRWIAWLACNGSLPSRTPPEPEGYQEAFPECKRAPAPLLTSGLG